VKSLRSSFFWVVTQSNKPDKQKPHRRRGGRLKSRTENFVLQKQQWFSILLMRCTALHTPCIVDLNTSPDYPNSLFTHVVNSINTVVQYMSLSTLKNIESVVMATQNCFLFSTVAPHVAVSNINIEKFSM